MNSRSSERTGASGSDDPVELAIEGNLKDLGGLTVRRTLPSPRLAQLGPFVFYDHVGPATLAPGQGFDVRPHPHIALATITYLFEGAFVHRDSLGSEQTIVPGDVNWMIAGRGIVHSERTPLDRRSAGSRLHGIQTWVALPREHEETEPRFEHHDAQALPRLQREGAQLHVVAGTAYGATAPTSVLSPTLYVHAQLEASATLAVDDEHEQRGVYVAEGAIECGAREFAAGTLLVLRSGARVAVRATTPARLMLIGGAALDGPRHVWWNFVSSSTERIERAKDDWRNGRFAKVPGDDKEFIPLPGRDP